MDIKLFRQHLANIQKLNITEDVSFHKGIRNTYGNRSYSKSETDTKMSRSAAQDVKDSLSRVSGAYEISAKKT